jgi:hypothetical protein
MVVDRENINRTACLSAFAINKGWTGNQLFKTQLAVTMSSITASRETQSCSQGSIFTRLLQSHKKTPEILQFHKPAMAISNIFSKMAPCPLPSMTPARMQTDGL